MNRGEPTAYRIGEIAAATGMTIRTSHDYEEIDLLPPTARTDAGHRLYGSDALQQLYRIAFLRQLGLPLNSVRSTMVGTHGDVRKTLASHLLAVEERLGTENRPRARLVRLLDALASDLATNGAAAGDLLDVLEDMTMLGTTINRRISILVYDDIEAAHDYLIRVFGLGPGEVMRGTDGNVVHAEIQAGDGEFWLHTESTEFDLRSPNHLGGSSSMMSVMVADVDAHHAHSAEQGAVIRFAPVDQPYGYREYLAIDPEGHLWSFMKPLG